MARSTSKHRSQPISKTRKESKKEISKESLKEIKMVQEHYRPWTPSGVTAFKALLSSCLCAAVWSNISDCDETFNYWEPAHYLIYKEGFQTWEYSPAYALRSYAYLLLYVLPGRLYQLLIPSNKIFMFYFIRFLMGLVCAVSEATFYKAICLHFGANIGRLSLLFLVLSSGMFISSTAFLPSSFSMYMIMLAYAAWFRHDYHFAILGIAVASLVGWPFVVALGIPVAADILLVRKKWLLFIKWSLISLLILVPMVAIDSAFYGRLTIAPLNIILYNVFSDHGPNLYGVEPWTFYFLNGFLNFNFVFVAALFSLPCFLLLWYLVPPVRKQNVFSIYVLTLVAFYLWMLIFVLQPHKEERFLFPIYPLICLAGAITLDCIQKAYFHVFVKLKASHYLDYSNWIAVTFCVLFSSLAISRSIVTYKGYRAPLEVYMELTRISQDMDPQLKSVDVCVGKEWHRYPSSFFLPYNWKFHFIKSEFRGQLPQPYSSAWNATQIIPEHMNDLNLEEPSRYVNINHCDLLVDSDFPTETRWEPRYSKNNQDWEVVTSVPFLDAKRSPQLLRAFYIPLVTEHFCTFVDYNLLKAIRRPRPGKSKHHNDQPKSGKL